MGRCISSPVQDGDLPNLLGESEDVVAFAASESSREADIEAKSMDKIESIDDKYAAKDGRIAGRK